MRGTASTLLVRRIIGAVAMRGVDPQSMIAAVGLAPGALDDPNARVPHATLLTTWTAAERLSQDPDFGLHMAEFSRKMPANALAFAVATSPSFDRALETIGRYVRIIHDAVRLRVVPDGKRARVVLHVDHPLGVHRHGVEFALSLVALLGREHVGRTFALHEASLTHGRPENTTEHERIFGVRPRFGHTENELVLDRALLEQPFEQHDVALHAHLSRHLDQMLAGIDAESTVALQSRVQKLVMEQLRAGAPDVDEVARKLALSARTLQRKLQSEGTSFQDVVNDARRELAMRYLGDTTITITEVAFLLGFTEPSNFHRAFKRWTGTTPAEARRRAIEGGGRAVA